MELITVEYEQILNTIIEIEDQAETLYDLITCIEQGTEADLRNIMSMNSTVDAIIGQLELLARALNIKKEWTIVQEDNK